MSKLHLVGGWVAIQNIQRSFVCGGTYAFGTFVTLFEARPSSSVWYLMCEP